MKFFCEVKVMDTIIHSETYDTLRDICKELNLSYQQVADISCKRRNKFDDNKFKYAPKITINKISLNL
jgi:hypothetical protein